METGFAGAELKEVLLNYARLANNNFRGARFTKCSFIETNLSGGNFEDSEFVECIDMGFYETGKPFEPLQ